MLPVFIIIWINLRRIHPPLEVDASPFPPSEKQGCFAAGKEEIIIKTGRRGTPSE